jgi:AcrR family transcriptional regulator
VPAPKPPPLALKEACVRAAREVIAEHGIEHLSLREVARKLGVSHQAPYRHYPSRDHLLAEVLRRCFEAFAQDLNARERFDDPIQDLESLGHQYLRYAAMHPLEYRLMFGTPWPDLEAHEALQRDAVHAFDVLRDVLRRIYGADAMHRAQVDLQALFVWSTIHGLATITQGDAMCHLKLAGGVERQAHEHVMRMVESALRKGPLD